MPHELLAIAYDTTLTGTGVSGSLHPLGYQKGCKCGTKDTSSCLTVSAHELDFIAQTSTGMN